MTREEMLQRLKELSIMGEDINLDIERVMYRLYNSDEIKIKEQANIELGVLNKELKKITKEMSKLNKLLNK